MYSGKCVITALRVVTST